MALSYPRNLPPYQEVIISPMRAAGRDFVQGRHADRYLKQKRVPVLASAERPDTSHPITHGCAAPLPRAAGHLKSDFGLGAGLACRAVFIRNRIRWWLCWQDATPSSLHPHQNIVSPSAQDLCQCGSAILPASVTGGVSQFDEAENILEVAVLPPTRSRACSKLRCGKSIRYIFVLIPGPL
ncbi:uncharacterized protein BDR25DRAFT_349192 [Lindgomyces ingoldianus]|uniref:Uncharacterized protein n=1 Tax=Lindgomyces ingoldianus TaxID=673940 RepID=A0ACB6RFJ5_9PLEO|nr:uncharacterized protein BDR25DRAFT_349192 [Lindgomyces ingoldianus]KAF2477246.1 hypothetical protein BDR25DRAFT_349192 [Lindgomyces ingoldianus]